MRPRCSPLSVRESISHHELHDRLVDALAWVAPEDRFVLPTRFADYLDVLDSRSWFGHHVALDFRLSAPLSIVEGAESETPDRHDDHEIVKDAGLWIAIGGWSDKHDYWLCCDRERPLAGHVTDAHDDHPWMNGVGMLDDLGTFEDWLDEVRQLRSRATGGHLIALTGEERVELDPVLGDPWQLVVAARDLEYAHRPDSAWKHAVGAPDRIVYVAKPPPVLADLALARTAESLVAFIPPTAMAAFEQLPSYALGGWNANRDFGFLESPLPRLRELLAASAAGGLLYIGNDDTPTEE